MFNERTRLVAECLNKMKSATSLPITIKTRIGYDDVEDYETFYNFISTLKKLELKHSLFMQEKQC